MTSFVTITTLEVRKRLDTAGAAAGFGVLVALVVACCAFSVSLVSRSANFDVGEVIVTAGLPAALAASIVGVVVGVGDAARGGERDGILAGLTRDAIFAARSAACAVIISAVVLFTVMCGFVGTGVAILIGGHVASWDVGQPVVQVAALSYSSAAFGFGLGASLRSLALGLVSVLVVMLVVDIVLGFLGTWTAYVRFGTLQSGLTGEASVLPTVSSGLIWVVLPITAGWIRARRVAT